MAVVKPQTPIINWGNPLTKGLTLHIPFSEGAGSIVNDLAIKTVGTWSGTLGNSQWTKSKLGQAANFNGTDNYISFPANDGLNSQVFTYAVWLNPTLAHGGSIKGCGVQFGTASCQLFATGFIEFDKQDQVAIGTSTIALVANVWSFVTLTYDVSGNWAFTVNGVSAGSGTNLQTVNTSSTTFIGTQYIPDANWYPGKMSQFSIWNRVLLSKEILSLYANPFQIYQTPRFSYLIPNAVVASTRSRQYLGLMGVGS